MAREAAQKESDGAPLWNITAGLDRSIVPVRLPDLGLDEAFNVIFVDGVVKPRPGTEVSEFSVDPHIGSINQTPAMFGYIRDRATQADTPIALTWDNSVTGPSRNIQAWIYDGSDWVASATFTTSSVDSTASSYDTPPQITAFKDVAIVLPGDGIIRVWIPADDDFKTLQELQSDTDLKAPYACRCVESSGSRVFVANGIEFGGTERKSNRVWWTDSSTYNIFSNGTGKPARGSASYEDLQQGEFGTYEITALKMHSSMQLLAFKAWGIWRATWAGDVVTWTFIPGTFKIGCISPRSIKQWRDRLIFFGTDYNIYGVDVGGTIQPLGTKLQRYISRIINVDNANRAFAEINPIDNIYYLFIPLQGEEFPRHIIALNLDTMSFSEGQFPEGLSVTSGYSYYAGFDTLPGIFLTRYAQGLQNNILQLTTANGCNDHIGGFPAHIWSKVYDSNEMYQGYSEMGEIHKIALHGDYGEAIARARSGQGISELRNASPSDHSLLEFGAIDVTANLQHYVSERTNSARFSQWGVRWEAGEDNPLYLQGVTVYGLPRGGFERGNR